MAIPTERATDDGAHSTWALPHGMMPEDALAACGPAWSEMSREEREQYGGERAPTSSRTVDWLEELLDIRAEFPCVVREAGLAVTVRALRLDEGIVALAERIEDDPLSLLADVTAGRIEQPKSQAQSAPFRERYPALTAWRQRLRKRIGGEHPGRSSTWRLDALWEAAALEAAAAEEERMAGHTPRWEEFVHRAREAVAGATRGAAA